MIEVAIFTFNAFQENTYLLYNEQNDAIIFDPGCNNLSERLVLDDFISERGLNVTRLILTHAHIDHILGNKHVAEKYNLELEMHKDEVPMLKAAPQIASMYAIDYEESPDPSRFIEEGEIIELGKHKLKALYTPGHSPASLSFYCKEQGFVIAGDVLFNGSIGRTDLPGGDFDTLIASIRKELLTLPDPVIVYPGHGPQTTVGDERISNPFLK